MTDGELMFLWIGFITGCTLSFLLIFIGDFITHRDLKKKMKREKESRR